MSDMPCSSTVSASGLTETNYAFSSPSPIPANHRNPWIFNSILTPVFPSRCNTHGHGLRNGRRCFFSRQCRPAIDSTKTRAFQAGSARNNKRRAKPTKKDPQEVPSYVRFKHYLFATVNYSSCLSTKKLENVRKRTLAPQN